MFKVGDRVVCINNNIAFKSSVLTHNKIYTIQNVDEHGGVGYPLLTVINDNGHLNHHYSYKFMSMEKNRRKKLKRICSRLVIG